MNSFILASVSFIIGVIIGKPIIALLRQLNGYQAFREQGPQSHIAEKAGTPTMGAWIFLIPIYLCGLYHAWQMHSHSVFLVLLAFFVGNILGAVDDLLKVLQSSYRGLGSKQKLIFQFILSSVIVYASERYLFVGHALVPEKFNFVLVIWEFIWAFCVIAGASNAINISDGLDGLATTLSILAFSGFAAIFYFENYFYLFDISVIVIAALIAFLIFNKKPAQVFMGDTGSLALGMGLGTLAYISKQELYLLVFAAVPVIETISVILQVLSAKLSRKFIGRDIRIFKMAPLHHHFELSGFSESLIVVIFAIFQLIILILGIFYYLNVS
tara:strand:+ start:826 stop:1806 length:981 start_codon:yes stop_codon:yes gene_type:complete